MALTTTEWGERLNFDVSMWSTFRFTTAVYLDVQFSVRRLWCCQMRRTQPTHAYNAYVWASVRAICWCWYVDADRRTICAVQCVMDARFERIGRCVGPYRCNLNAKSKHFCTVAYRIWSLCLCVSSSIEEVIYSNEFRKWLAQSTIKLIWLGVWE